MLGGLDPPAVLHGSGAVDHEGDRSTAAPAAPAHRRAFAR
jgi:hypothetical protein